MEIIGHEKIISYFNKVIANGALSQSYCFVGSNGVGKKTVARYLAAKILQIPISASAEIEDPRFCSKAKSGQLDTHPDFYFISRQVDEKTEKIKKDISAAQARQIKEKLGRKSWFGGYQVIIIDEAELLNEESGNALLKNLEEAGGQRVFFLLTSDDSELLPTIRSRCQMFYFSLVNIKDIEAGLIKLGYGEELSVESAKISWGRPGRAITLAGNDDSRKNFNAEIERWQKIEGAPFYQKIKAVEDLFNEKIDALRTSEKLSNALETWTVLWRNKILDTIDAGGDSVSLLQTAGLVDSFKNAQVLLSQNINPRLVVEQVLLQV